MPYLIGYDPGLTTGVAVGWYTEDTALAILDSWNTTFEELSDKLSWGAYEEFKPHSYSVIVEKFKLSSGNKYTADLTGVQVEGLLRHYYSDIAWQYREDKSIIPNKVLKDNGYWVDKKSSNWTDGKDQNDVRRHLLVWLLRSDHKPTIEQINPKG